MAIESRTAELDAIFTQLPGISRDQAESLLDQRKSVRPETSPCCTDVKIQRIALYTIAAAIAIAGVGLAAISVTGIIPWPFAFFSLSLFAGSAGLIYLACEMKDYEDPVELQYMKDRALEKSFSELYNEHGLEIIKKYQILTSKKLQEKFKEETQFLPFSSLINKHSIDEIKTFNLAPVEELQHQFFRELLSVNITDFNKKFSPALLSTLSRQEIISPEQSQTLSTLLEQKRTAYITLLNAIGEIHRKYPTRQDVRLEDLETRKSAARQRAKETTQTVRNVGHAATDVATVFQYNPNKKGSENLKTQMATQMQGAALTELATLPAEIVANTLLQQELSGIQNERTLIINGKVGLSEQIDHDREINKAQEEYKAELARIEEQFQAFKSKIA
jgi:hypothetical protein